MSLLHQALQIVRSGVKLKLPTSKFEKIEWKIQEVDI